MCCTIKSHLLKKKTFVPVGSVQLLTPSSLLFMILMATFSPVRMCRPNLTLAKPPEKASHLAEIERAEPLAGGLLNRTSRYLNRWSHKLCSICGAPRHQGSPSFAQASFLHLPAEEKNTPNGRHLKQKSNPNSGPTGGQDVRFTLQGSAWVFFCQVAASNALKPPRSNYLYGCILKLCKHMYSISNVPEFA